MKTVIVELMPSDALKVVSEIEKEREDFQLIVTTNGVGKSAVEFMACVSGGETAHTITLFLDGTWKMITSIEV